MKRIFLLSTRLYIFLIELPLVFLLTLAIIFNGRADGLLKLYPLIVTLSLAIIFIFLYFFRGIKIKYDEIKDVGLFSKRDKVVLNKDKTLIITVLQHKKLKIELFGFDGKAGLDWLKDEEPKEIYLYRGKAIGGKSTPERILRFFEVSEEDLEKILIAERFSNKYQYVSVESSVKNEMREIRIRFEETM